MGAIVILEQESKLDEFSKSGTPLDSILTPELLKTIFSPIPFFTTVRCWCAATE